MPDESNSQSDSLESKMEALVDQKLASVTQERSQNKPDLVPDADTDETTARVKREAKESDVYRAYHVLRMMEGNAKGNDQMKRRAAEQLIRGGHYGDEAVRILNNGARAEDAIATAEARRKNRLAEAMYDGSDGPQYRAAGDFYSTVIDADGGFLLPTEVVQRIEEIAEQVGVILGLSDTYSQIEGQLKVPGAAGADSAMSFIAEGGAITSRMRAFRAVTLNPQKVADILPWTYEIQVEAGPRILADIQRVMGRNYGKAVDDASLFGDGTSSYNSIDGLASTNRSVSAYTIDGGSANDGTEFGHILPDDLKLAKLSIAPSVRSGATFVFHPDMKDGVFETFKDDNGAYIFDYNSSGAMDSIAGVPVVYSEVLPGLDEAAIDQTDSTFGVLGNFQYLKIAQGQGISTEEMRTGTITDADDGSDINLGTQDLRALKYRAFFDIDLNFEDAFTLINTAA